MSILYLQCTMVRLRYLYSTYKGIIVVVVRCLSVIMNFKYLYMTEGQGEVEAATCSPYLKAWGGIPPVLSCTLGWM